MGNSCRRQCGPTISEHTSRNDCASVLKACGFSLSTSMVPSTFRRAPSKTGTMISDLVVSNAVR